MRKNSEISFPMPAPEDKSESYLLRQCRKILDTANVVYRRIHISGMRYGGGSRGRNVDMEGMFDLMLFFPRGVTAHVELKRANGGKLSQKQIEWQRELEKLGHQAVIVDSIDDLLDLLKQNGVLVTV